MTHDVYGVGGVHIQNGTDGYDMLERPLVSGDLLLSGGSDRREVRYDALGRLVKQAAPCNCVFRAKTDTIPTRWRTAFRGDDGHGSGVMADDFAA